MKKILCVFLMFMMLLPMAASAEQKYYTIGELKDQVTDRWTRTYETKWRTVTVDVQPTVPDVSEMPVLLLSPSLWSPLPNGDVEWTGNQNILEEFGAQPGAFSITCNDDPVPKYSNEWEVETKHFYAPFISDYPYMLKHDLTIGQILQKLEEVTEQISNRNVSYDTDHLPYFMGNYYYDKNTKEHTASGEIWLSLYLSLHDIPIYGHIIESIFQPKATEPFYYTSLSIKMSSSKNYRINGYMLDEEEILATDIPLCSYERILHALESEVSVGRLRAVYGLNLGYALYNEPGAKIQELQKIGNEKWKQQWLESKFYAVPTWQCLALYTMQAQTDLTSDMEDPIASMYYKPIYVNAQTGKLLDPLDNHLGCASYQGFISWNQVQN